MLPKHDRLTKQTIEKHLIRARRLKTSRFLVLYTTIAGQKRPEVAMSVSKKVAPKAVLRNKLRRRGYAALRPLIPFLSPGTAALISYSVPDVTISIPELTKELQEILKTARLLVK